MTGLFAYRKTNIRFEKHGARSTVSFQEIPVILETMKAFEFSAELRLIDEYEQQYQDSFITMKDHSTDLLLLIYQPVQFF